MYRPRVLIIEADRRTVDELQERFERHGIEAEVALNVAVGLTILAERRMDAAVIDAQFEVMNEWTLLQRVKEVDPNVPVVMINGDKSKGISKVARRAGVTRFLSSPVDPEKVILALSDVIRN